MKFLFGAFGHVLQCRNDGPIIIMICLIGLMSSKDCFAKGPGETCTLRCIYGYVGEASLYTCTASDLACAVGRQQQDTRSSFCDWRFNGTLTACLFRLGVYGYLCMHKTNIYIYNIYIYILCIYLHVYIFTCVYIDFFLKKKTYLCV